MLPSDLLRMPIDNVVGIVCEKGGITAHMAILSKALNIPALLGVKGAFSQINKNDELFLDCFSGKLYINAENKVKEHYKELENKNEKAENIPTVF